ncbi:MAG: hypothetical protein CMP25_00705 [Rickettsiales bacterium]|nr:hypothetical protein [Rickettsiales bacterium]
MFLLNLITFVFLILFHSTTNSKDKNELILHNTIKEIESFQLIDLEKKKINFKKFTKFDFFIINFWATWCTPCIKEIPDLLKLEQKFKKKFKVIFISMDSNPKETISKFLKKNKFKNFNTYTDTDFSITKKLKVKVMPTTIIANKNLQEISRIIGYHDWLSPETIELLKKL